MAQTKVKPELLTGGFNTVTALTPASTITVDYDSAQIFTLTPTSNTILNITDPIIGAQKNFIITGSGNSYTITLNVGGSANTFNKATGDYDDSSGVKNLYSILCVGTNEFWYSIIQAS
tara:strand:- start:1340 stop:1693 length:354 start_codon:yes stop_codon:yes gene_type:complete